MRIPSGPTEQRGGRGRGIIAGGDNPTYLNSIEYIEIATTGNATDFGDLSEIKRNLTGASSSTRGVVIGGQISPGNYATKGIEYVTISSGGGASDFGDLRPSYRIIDSAGVTSNIRGFACGGVNTPDGESQYGRSIDYITFATLGDATKWAELSHTGRQLNAGCESGTRGIIGGGYAGPNPNNTAVNTIQYITFGSQGNSELFGSLTVARRNVIAVSDKTRGVFMGGTAGPNVIDYITMASLGNAIDFGDLTISGLVNGAPAQNTTRGVYMGGDPPSPLSAQNTITYITIQSVGNATDFGDLITARENVPAGLCDVNGGLG
tara:strand:- start:35 stop:997 length:963 start_codon:yes stop_codon:yes gene_type:complete